MRRLRHQHWPLMIEIIRLSQWPTQRIVYRVKLALLSSRLGQHILLQLSLGPCETLSLHFVVLHELISANVLHTFLVQDVLAYFLECFINSAIDLLRKEQTIL